MNKKFTIILIAALTLFVASSASFAMSCCADEGDTNKSAYGQTQQSLKAQAIDVGNKNCPVTGENIDEGAKAKQAAGSEHSMQEDSHAGHHH